MDRIIASRIGKFRHRGLRNERSNIYSTKLYMTRIWSRGLLSLFVWCKHFWEKELLFDFFYVEGVAARGSCSSCWGRWAPSILVVVKRVEFNSDFIFWIVTTICCLDFMRNLQVKSENKNDQCILSKSEYLEEETWLKSESWIIVEPKYILIWWITFTSCFT